MVALVLAAVLTAAPVLSAAPPQPAAPSPTTPEGAATPYTTTESPYCPGKYADEFSALSEKARQFELRQPPYTYCLRTTAVYECPSYAPDGSMRRTRRKVIAHGTGFGFRQQPGETLIVTNQHVAEWPAVTDEDHTAGDVPAGCKRVSDSVKIVESEKDDYERDDIPLTRVVSDAQLDVAVLRAKVSLPIMPWRLGHSAALRERNSVDVRGFPLGVLRANNVGKVVSAYDHDEDREWDHDDFVVDAQLSPGNSGSPVFAISCETGEFELVGVYHAGYFKASALNVVVGIDQLRDLLTTLKRAPRARRDAATPLTVEDRSKLIDVVHRDAEPLFFPFGGAATALRTRADGALVFALMSKEFPVQAHPALVIEDLPSLTNEGFGRLGRFWAGNRQGLREVEHSSMDAEIQAALNKLLDAFRRTALLAGAYHGAMRSGMISREEFLGARRLEGSLRRSAESSQDLAQAGFDIVERLCPPTADANSTLADAMTVPTPVVELTAVPAPSSRQPLGSLVGTRLDWRLIITGDAAGQGDRPAPIVRLPR
jgi:serine protease Do